MTLHKPFEIGSRLLPCLRIGDRHETAFLSLDAGPVFWLDMGGATHLITDFRPAPSERRDIPKQFAAMLSFLGAAGEAYGYKMAWPDSDPENLGLFPDFVNEWAYRFQDEIDTLRCDIEEAEKRLIED